MVIHAIAKACQAELSLHSFTANIVETSMIAFFIAIGQMALGECSKTIAHGRMGLGLMGEVMKVPLPGVWFTYGAWIEYEEVMKLVLDGQEELLKRLGSSFATCNEYWCKWAH
jgi:hypothetical protein